MDQSREESPPSRIELVVLACLSQDKPPGRAKLGQAVQQLVLPGQPAEAARQRAVELVAELVRRAWVTGDDEMPGRKKQRKRQSPRKLTESGKRVLRSAFNLARTPTWAEVRDQHLPRLALGAPPEAEVASKVCTESALMAAVLCARFGIRGASNPMAVCDALIADALGMPRGKLTLDRLRSHVLARGLDLLAGDAPSPAPEGAHAPTLAAWLACSAVGASGRSRNKMARAISQRWVREDPNPLGTCLAPTTISEPARSGAGATRGSPVAAAPPPAEQQPALEQGRSAQLQVPDREVAKRSAVSADDTPPRAPRGPATTPQARGGGVPAQSPISAHEKQASGTGAPAQPSASAHEKQPPAISRERDTPPDHRGTRPPAPPDTRRPGPTSGTVTQPPVPPASPHTQLPLPNLLDVVRDAIPRIGAEGRFGEKVYVSAIWRTIERDRKAGDLSLDHFKRWLVRANRDGWLVLARADLIGAMDAKQVNESEINDRGATFHFVLDHRNGASVSQREHHAR